MESPHDTLFQFTFRHGRHAAGWLRSVLPDCVRAAIDWSALGPLQRRFGPLPDHVTARVRAGSEADFDRWTDRVLDAATLAAVFAG